MRRKESVGGLLVLLACLVPVFAADEKKEGKKDKADDPGEKLVVVGQITGKLSRVEGAQKYLVVQVSQTVLVPSNTMGNQLALLQQQQAIMRNPNPIARRQQLVQLMLQMQSG